MMQAGSGRPVRFFAMLMIGWITIRLVAPGSNALTPLQEPRLSLPPTLAGLIVSPGRSDTGLVAAVAQERVVRFTPQAIMRAGALPDKRERNGTWGSTGKIEESVPVDLMNFIRFTVAFANRHYRSDRIAQNSTQPPLPPVLSLPILVQPPSIPPVRPATSTPDRWQAGGWMFWRDGSGVTAADSGQLGGSQMGFRLDFDLTPSARSRAMAYVRLSRALQYPAAPEAAVGLAFQPVRAVPISLAVERRIALGKGARNANSLMAVGGFGPTAITPSIEAQGYAQAGVVGLRTRDPFVDGKLSLFTPISQSPFRVGASLSGGAQPHVERLDVGPELQFRLPLRQASGRMTVEWRGRVAGDAAPASGLAVTLAADF